MFERNVASNQFFLLAGLIIGYFMSFIERCSLSYK